MSLAEATRKQLRAFMHTEKERPDGTSYTKPSAEQRRAEKRKKAKVARKARKRNRRGF